MRGAGAEALILEGDLAQSGAARGWSTRRREQFGRLDVVVSNAGFADRRPIGELDRAGWDASLAAMTSAFFELAAAAKPWLVKAGAAGRLVGVSSFVAHAFARGLHELSGVGRRQGRHGGAGARFCGRDRAVGRHGQLRGAGLHREGCRRPRRGSARAHGAR